MFQTLEKSLYNIPFPFYSKRKKPWFLLSLHIFYLFNYQDMKVRSRQDLPCLHLPHTLVSVYFPLKISPITHPSHPFLLPLPWFKPSGILMQIVNVSYLVLLNCTNRASSCLMKHNSQHGTLLLRNFQVLHCFLHNKIQNFQHGMSGLQQSNLKLPFKIISLYFLLHTLCSNQNKPLIFHPYLLPDIPTTSDLWVFCSFHLEFLPFPMVHVHTYQQLKNIVKSVAT